jgi:Tfp pilus assembly protein PilV
MNSPKNKPVSKRALTLVETILALVVLSLGVLAGVELMAQITATDAQQNVWSGWENRLMQARARIEAMSQADFDAQTNNGGKIMMEDLNISAQKGDEAQNPYPASCTTVKLNILDNSGNTFVTLPMLKINSNE